MRPPSPTEVGAGALVIAALAVGRVITGIAPDSDVASKPYEHEVVVGTAAHVRWGEVKATRVEGSRSLGQAGDSLSYGSPTVWLIVSLDYTPRVSSKPPAQAFVRGGNGTEITKGPRNEWRCDPANPGIPTHCGAAFEVPLKALPGSRLVIGYDQDQDNHYDDQVVVDLGVSKADAKRWNAQQGVVMFPLDRRGS